MDAEKILEKLEEDHMARLRHVILRSAGICPFGLRAALISDRQILLQACHRVLDARSAERDSGSAGFDRQRFERLKEMSG